jgi:hypothetical protein
MHVFRFDKYCGKAVINSEYSTSKPCSQLNLSSFHLLIFIIREVLMDQDTKNKRVFHILAAHKYSHIPV